MDGPARPLAHAGGDRRGGRLPADGGPRPQEFQDKKDWFFKPWNAETVRGPEDRQARSPSRMLPPSCFAREPGALGAASRRQLARLRRYRRRLVHARPDQGRASSRRAWATTAGSRRPACPPPWSPPTSPASASCPTRVTDFQIMFLFSIGITKGKWGTLLNNLLDFKRDYDANRHGRRCPAGACCAASRRYRKVGLRDLGDEMFEYICARTAPASS